MIGRIFALLLFLVLLGAAQEGRACSETAGQILLEQTTEIYQLVGQWRFTPADYPEFALPEYDDRSWGWLQVPGIWSMMGVADTTLAWYRCRFRLVPSFEVVPIAIRVPAIYDAHELYLNGVLIGGAGKISADGTILKKNSLPGVYRIPDSLLNKQDWNVIALRVGDDAGWGGISTSDFYLGRWELLDLEFRKFIVWNGSVSIILAFLGIYFMVLFLVHTRERSYLYFSLFALVISLMLFGYFSFPYWLIDSFWVNHFAVNTGVHIALVFFFFFIYAFFEYPPDRILKLITLAGLLLFGILLLTPLHLSLLRFYGRTAYNIALAINGAGFGYLLWLLVKSIIIKKQGAKTMGAGTLVLMVCFLNDIFGYLVISTNQRLAAEGTVIFMICISFAMFFKFARINAQNEGSKAGSNQPSDG